MLRDIHSLKLTQTRRWAENLRFSLIALSVSATCLSFIGASTVAKDLGVGAGPVEFVIDVILLLLLLVIVAELAWRRGDRSHEHQRAMSCSRVSSGTSSTAYASPSTRPTPS